MTARDSGGDVNGYEQLAASGFGTAVSGIKVLQLTTRSVDFAVGNNYQIGGYVTELDANLTATPAAAPEPGAWVTLAAGTLVLGITRLRRRFRTDV